MEVFSMGRRIGAVAATVLLGASVAWAQNPAPRNSADSPYTDTVYATDQHMAFSIRNTVIHWLGGVDVVHDRDTRASEKDGWWGEPVAQVPPEMARPPKSSDR
jgi:hypothetical protein